MLPAWLRSIIKRVNNGQSGGREPRKAGGSRHCFRPRCEQLEDRVVPTQIYLSTGLVGTRGSIVQVAVNVNSLDDAGNGNLGMSAAQAVIYYDQTVFTVANSSVTLGTIATNGFSTQGEGYSPENPNSWGLNVNTNQAGQIAFGLSTSSTITDSGSGSLVLINFQVKSNAPLGVTNLNLGPDFFGSTYSSIYDENFNRYTLNPPPQDNVTSLSPYTYIGTSSTDQDDSTITILGTTPPPVASNDAYAVTARSVASDPSLTVGANAVQTLTFSGNPTTGSFTLAVASLTTSPISYSTSVGTLQSNIQTALAGLSSIGTANVTVSAASNALVTVTFQGGLGGQTLPTMTVTNA